MNRPPGKRFIRKGRKTLRSVQARAAVESVLVPVCGKNLAFPPRPDVPEEIRRVWRLHLNQLRLAGWKKVQSCFRYNVVRKCPWGLLGLDDHRWARADDRRWARAEDLRRCQLHGCPACHGHKSALLADRVLRLVRADPDVHLRLLERTRDVEVSDVVRVIAYDKANPDPAAAGYFREVTVELVAPNRVRVRTAYLLVNPGDRRRGKRVRTHLIGVVKAVAMMRPYGASNLGHDWDPAAAYQADLLNLLAGVRLSSCAGVARTAGGAARTLKKCAKVFLTSQAVKPAPVPALAAACGEDAFLFDGDEFAPDDEADPDTEVVEDDEHVVPPEAYLFQHTKNLTRAEMLAEMEAREAERRAEMEAREAERLTNPEGEGAGEDEDEEENEDVSGDMYWMRIPPGLQPTDSDGLADRIGPPATGWTITHSPRTEADIVAELIETASSGLLEDTSENPTTAFAREVAEGYWDVTTTTLSGRQRRKAAPFRDPPSSKLIPLSTILRRVPQSRNSPSSISSNEEKERPPLRVRPLAGENSSVEEEGT